MHLLLIQSLKLWPELMLLRRRLISFQRNRKASRIFCSNSSQNSDFFSPMSFFLFFLRHLGIFYAFKFFFSAFLHINDNDLCFVTFSLKHFYATSGFSQYLVFHSSIFNFFCLSFHTFSI